MSTTISDIELVTRENTVHRPQKQSFESQVIDIANGNVLAPNASSTLTIQPDREVAPSLSTYRTAIIVFQLSGVNFISSLTTGLIMIGLPKIATDLNLPAKLYLWPVSVFTLATGAALMLAGAIADVVGARTIDLIGCFSIAAILIGTAFVQTGEQLVALRAMQGLATSLHLPSSVSICAAALPRGRGRNVAFSCLGLSTVLGFSVGLVVGGIFVDTVGWRFGWYLCGPLSLVLAVIGIWSLPKVNTQRRVSLINDLATKVDWVGAGIACGFVTMVSYVLALVSADVSSIRHTECITLLCIGVVLGPAFVYWMHVQVKAKRPALVPNTLWNTPFTSVCVIMTLSFAVLQSMELFSSLFFQEVQHLSALQASLRILPSLIVGGILNLTTGLFVSKVPVIWLVVISSLLCSGGPVLMATIRPEFPYWYNAFFAQLLQPISADIMFTVSLIIVSEIFPDNAQGLAGAVFNTVSKFGSALGLAIMQVISSLVTDENSKGRLPDSQALMAGYRASFWAMFAFMLCCLFIGGCGLRKIGKVGIKQD